MPIGCAGASRYEHVLVVHGCSTFVVRSMTRYLFALLLISARDLGFGDFDLPLYDDSMNDSGSEGINSRNDEVMVSQIKAHDSYDDDVGEQTPNASSTPILVSEDGDEVGNKEVSLIYRKIYRGLIAFVAFVVVLSVGECSSGGRRDESLLQPKVPISFSENSASPVISWLHENETFHRENCALRDEFNRVSDLVKSYVSFSGGVSRNVQVFRDQYVNLIGKVAELEKLSSGVGMVLKINLEKSEE
ncbi:unnamed protein product [Lactuca saligna]|uniref:Uncharacterized protein n=1 Tax=Lactuca saligna TaxID=75948 RepID=A0AA35ZIK6_LACSI|nr:unnamed protein product [Lactuca saligna]